MAFSIVNPAPADPLVYALERANPIVTLDYLDAQSVSRLVIEAQIMEGLMGFDPANDVEAIPRLAKDYQKMDERTYVFELREDVLFHPHTHGSTSKRLVSHAVRPTDVVFSLRRALPSADQPPEWAASNSHLLEQVELVRTAKGHLIKIKVEDPSPSLLSALATNLGHVTCQEYYEGLGPDAKTRKRRFEKAPIGTGPYRLVGTLDAHEDRVVLTRFDGYRDQAWVTSSQSIETVEFRNIGTLTGISEAMRKGVVHMSHFMLSEFGSGSGLIDFERKPMPVQVNELETPYLSILAFNLKQPYLADPEIRRLLNLAVDKAEIVAACPTQPSQLPDQLPVGYRSYLEIVAKSLQPRSPERLATELRRPETQERLETLRKKLQQHQRTEGLVLWVAGRPDPTRTRILGVVQRAIQALDIDVKIEYVSDWDLENASHYDLLYYEWTPDTPHERDDLAILYPLFSPQSDQNISLYDNHEVDRLFKRIGRVHDPADRRILYKQIQDLLLEDSPHIWLPSVRSTTLVLHRDFSLGSGHSLFVYFTSFIKEVQRNQ